MNNNYVIEENWTGLVLQWVFLFALLAMVYFVGWLFGRLAKKHQRKGWKYMILGILIFMTGISFGAEIEDVIMKYSESGEMSYPVSGLVRLPFAILLCLASYKFLQNNWIRARRTD